MQQKVDSVVIARTYNQAVTNIKNGKHPIGYAINKDAITYYANPQFHHPFEKLLDELSFIKSIYQKLKYKKGATNADLAAIKVGYIEPLRAIIADALEHKTENIPLDAELIEILAEIGEVSLFMQAYNKLRNQLRIDELVSLLATMNVGYQGSRFSEPKGLGVALLHRGDSCYIAMTEWLLNDLHKLGKASDVLNVVFQNSDHCFRRLPDLINSEIRYQSSREFVVDMWLLHQDDTDIDQEKYRAECQRQYYEFVTKHKAEHLYWKLIHNFSTNPRIIQENSSKIEPVASTFLFKMIANNQLMQLAGVLVVIGIVALAALSGTAAAAGGASLGIGLLVGAYGFFGPSAKLSPEQTQMIEHDFFVGYSA